MDFVNKFETEDEDRKMMPFYEFRDCFDPCWKIGLFRETLTGYWDYVPEMNAHPVGYVCHVESVRSLILFAFIDHIEFLLVILDRSFGKRL